MISLIDTVLQFVLKIWGWVSGHAREKLEKRRLQLEEESRQAQINGDLDGLRKARAEIEEIDRKLITGDY